MGSGSDTPKLWPESFRLLRASRRSWLSYALLFFVLLIPADAWQISEAGPYNQKVGAVYEDFFNTVGNEQDPMSAYQATQDKIDAIPSPSPLTDIVPSILTILALYFFYIRLLAALSVLGAPKASAGGIGIMVLKLFQKYIIIVVPPVLLGSLCGVAMALPLPLIGQALLCVLLLTAAVVFGGYYFCRYTVVLPLALSGVKSGLRRSGELTKTHIWRLAGAYAVITTILLPPMLVMPLTPMLAGTPDKLVLLGLAGIVAASQLTVAVVFAAFGCAAFTALYSEKQAAEPGFKLLSSV